MAGHVLTSRPAELETHARRNAGRNLFLTGELRTLLDLFHSCALRVIPFKGPLFASSIYGNLALRQYALVGITAQPIVDVMEK